MSTCDISEKSVIGHVNRCKNHVYHFHGESVFSFGFWTLNAVGAIERWIPLYEEVFNVHLVNDSSGVKSFIRIGSKEGDEYIFDVFVAGQTLKESLHYVGQRLKTLTNKSLEFASMIEAQDDLIEIDDPVRFSCYLSEFA